MPKLGELTIIHHYDPPPPDEMAELIHRVFDVLLTPDMLDSLTGPPGSSTIQKIPQGGGDSEGASESREIRPRQPARPGE